jgi:hypothetical protein
VAFIGFLRIKLMPNVDKNILEYVNSKYGENFGEVDPQDKDFLYFHKLEEKYNVFKFEEIEELPLSLLVQQRKGMYYSIYDYLDQMEENKWIKITGFNKKEQVGYVSHVIRNGKIKTILLNKGYIVERRPDFIDNVLYLKKTKVNKE